MRSQTLSHRTPLSEVLPSATAEAHPQLTTTYFQGDFARGQRTLSVPAVVVGTFAARRAANRSAPLGATSSVAKKAAYSEAA